MTQVDSEVLGALALSFDERAQRAYDALTYTRSGYLSRESVGLEGMAVAFTTAARELRAVVESEAVG